MIINKATAIYSGGNIYLYYAELEDGNWLIGNDDTLMIVDESPLKDEKTFEESGYNEWQLKHMIKYVPDEDHGIVLIQLLETMLAGSTIPEWDNYSILEMEHRLRRLKEESQPEEKQKIRKTVIELKPSGSIVTDVPAELIANNLTFTGICTVKDLGTGDVYILTSDSIKMAREYEEEYEEE